MSDSPPSPDPTRIPITSDAEFLAVKCITPGWSPSRRCFVAPQEVDASAPITMDPDGITVTRGELIVRGFVPATGGEMSMSPALAELVRGTP